MKNKNNNKIYRNTYIQIQNQKQIFKKNTSAKERIIKTIRNIIIHYKMSSNILKYQ